MTKTRLATVKQRLKDFEEALKREKEKAEGDALLIEHDLKLLNDITTSCQTLETRVAASIKVLAKVSGPMNLELQNLQNLTKTPGLPNASEIAKQATASLNSLLAQVNPQEMSKVLTGSKNAVKESTRLWKQCKPVPDTKKAHTTAKAAIDSLTKSETQGTKLLTSVVEDCKAGMAILKKGDFRAEGT